MHFITIYHTGQCRGRPPTYATSRDGPAGSSPSSVVSSQSSVGICHPEYSEGRQPVPKSVAISGSSIALLSKLKNGSLQFSCHISEIRNQPAFASLWTGKKSAIRNHKRSRDWPAATCSYGSKIDRNRRNDRSITLLTPAQSSRTGGVCPVEMHVLNELMNVENDEHIALLKHPRMQQQGLLLPGRRKTAGRRNPWRIMN